MAYCECCRGRCSCGGERVARGFVCAECGDAQSRTYVVTILDRRDPVNTRTEVCFACDQALRAAD